MKKEKPKDSHVRKKHERALKAAQRKKAFDKKKEKWKLGIGL
jgi:hypothetical protein